MSDEPEKVALSRVRAYTRASGVFRFFPSPLHLLLLTCWGIEWCVWRLHPFVFTLGEGKNAPFVHLQWVEYQINVFVGEGWRQKNETAWGARRVYACARKHPFPAFSKWPKGIEKTRDDFGKSSRVFEKRRELFHDWSATNYKEVVVYFEDPYAAWQKGTIKMQLNLSGRIVQNTTTSMGLPIQRLRVYRRNQ